jgi:cobalamin biosynthesis protein CobD/CbiB
MAAMSLLCVVAALFLEQLRPLSHPTVFELAFDRYAGRVAQHFNAGEAFHGAIGWSLGVVPWVVVVLVVQDGLTALNPLLGWAFAVAVLYACINFKPATQSYASIADALRAGELDRARELLARWRGEAPAPWSEAEIARAALETILVHAYRDLLAVIAWFVVLPVPVGAVLYKLSAFLADKWGRRADEEFGAFGHFASRALWLLDWVPLRLTAIGFAVAGDLEDALHCWRTQARSWPDPEAGVILASGAGALGARLGGPLANERGVNYRPALGTGDEPDVNYMQSALGLIWRTLVIWLIVLLLVTLARWVGA